VSRIIQRESNPGRFGAPDPGCGCSGNVDKQTSNRSRQPNLDWYRGNFTVWGTTAATGGEMMRDVFPNTNMSAYNLTCNCMSGIVMCGCDRIAIIYTTLLAACACAVSSVGVAVFCGQHDRVRSVQVPLGFDGPDADGKQSARKCLEVVRGLQGN